MMFDFLKKKITNFVDTLTRKEEKAIETKTSNQSQEEQKSMHGGGSIEPQTPIETAPQKEEKFDSQGFIELDSTATQEREKTLSEETETEKLIEQIQEPPIETRKEIPSMEEAVASEIIEEIELEPKIEPAAKMEAEKITEPVQKAKEPELKITHIPKAKEENIEKTIRKEILTPPIAPVEIAKEREELAKPAMHQLPIQKEIIEEEREIEELVGETEEERIRKEAKFAEDKIISERRKEEVARKVFSKDKEDFLAAGKERDLKPKVGIFSKLKGLFTGEVEIGEKETAELFDQFEMALLESDVSYPTAQALIMDLKKRLIGRKVRTGKIEEEVKKEIAFALASVLQASRSDFFEKVREAKKAEKLPFIVVFLGPNGMGKTTTIAKVAHNLKKHGYTSVISASDTFRAAAIEQSMHHGEKLGIKVVKHNYGADPAAVAYDAINHAKSSKLDVVLIDTAGRQETNLNLLAEMQKIVRVVRPDLKIFIAEAIAGSSLVSQVKTFNEKMGVDGIILTKLDCDAKGGGSLSIAYECKLPVYFVGTGQGYDDLLEFNEEWIVKNIMAE